MSWLPSPDACIYLVIEPVDFRQGLDRLAIYVQGILKQDPFSQSVFVFSNKKRDRVKMLYWLNNGFCLWMKRLEQDRFKWPLSVEDALVIDPQQLDWLLEGFDISLLKGHSKRTYQHVY